MFILKKIGCRAFQIGFRIALPVLPYREPKVVSSCSELGGVGESGMGSYHGKDGFEAFSHYKSIVDKKTWLDLPMRYQPYKSKLYEMLLHIFLR